MDTEFPVIEVHLADIIKEEITCVIKIQTSSWSDSRGIHIKKDLNFCRRLISGYNVLEDDANCCGVSESVSRIVNLEECEDGLYQVIMCNISHDHESGTIDDYDFKLIPYQK